MKTWNNRVTLAVVAIFGLILSGLSACSSPSNESTAEPERALGVWEGSQTEPVPSPQSDKFEEKLLASLPEKKIYLTTRPNGLKLTVGKHAREYEWIYDPTKDSAARLSVLDYDRDGHDEIAVILYIGSGTGVAIQELHMIGIDEEQDNFMEDQVYKEEDYLSQLQGQLSFRTRMQGSDLIGEVKVGDQASIVQLKKYWASEYGEPEQRLAAGNIVYVGAEHNALQIEFGVGCYNDKLFEPLYIGSVFADILYRSGMFTLSNTRFVAYPEYQ